MKPYKNRHLKCPECGSTTIAGRINTMIYNRSVMGVYCLKCGEFAYYKGKYVKIEEHDSHASA